MTKEQLLKTAAHMPETFHLDELFEQLVLIPEIEEAQNSLDEGKGVSHVEAVRQIREHLKNLKNGGNNLVA